MTDRKTNRQTKKETGDKEKNERQTDRQTERQTDRQTDRQTARQKERPRKKLVTKRPMWPVIVVENEKPAVNLILRRQRRLGRVRQSSHVEN